MMSIISFVTVSIAMVLYTMNSSYIKRLVSKSKEHENEMINRAVIQDNKIRSVVDAVNNNDEIADRENKRLEQHVSAHISDLLVKNKNTDEKVDKTIKEANDINKELKEQIETVNDNLFDRVKDLTEKDADLDLKFTSITNSNVNLTKQLTHANEHLIQSNSNYVVNFEGRTTTEFERIQKDMDDNHNELFQKILDIDRQVRTDFVEADELVRSDLSTKIEKSKSSLTDAFNDKLNNYVMTSTLNDHKSKMDQFFSTKMETQSNSARIYDLEKMNIEQRFNDVHDEIHNVEGRFEQSNLQINNKHNKLRNDFDDFKMYEYATFSNLVVGRQQQNFEDLKNTFGDALSNLDNLVDLRQDGFETHFATKDFVRTNFYDRSNLDTLLDAKQIAITNAIKGDITDDVTFRGLQGLQGDPGVGIRKIEKTYDDEMQQDYLDFTLTDAQKQRVAVPAGRHGSYFTNFRIEGGNMVYDKISYDLNNNPIEESSIVFGTAPTNGIDGTNGTDGVGIREITTNELASSENPDNSMTRVNIKLTNDTINTFDIHHGSKGDAGVSVTAVEALTNQEIYSNSLVDTNVYYNIVLSNGDKQLLSIPKGLKGEKGDKGDPGEFDQDNSGLSLSRNQGLCLRHRGINFGCIPFDTLKDEFYTKQEYMPLNTGGITLRPSY